jgi:hypothetical protein
MSNKQLDSTIEDFISTFEETSRKEIKFILDNNWCEIKDKKIRGSRHDLQVLLIERNLNQAIKLHALCKGDTKHPKVKSVMEMLLKFVKTYEERKELHFKSENWMEYLDIGLTEADIRLEIEFQSEILKNLSEYKEKLRKINFGEDSAVIDIPIYGSIPVPLMMSSIIEERYPEIVEFLAKKREAFYSTPAPKIVKNTTRKKKVD